MKFFRLMNGVMLSDEGAYPYPAEWVTRADYERELIKHAAHFNEEMEKADYRETAAQEHISSLKKELNIRTAQRDETERKLSIALNFVPCEGVPHLFTAGWDAGFQEAMTRDEHPDQDRCTETYWQMVGSGMIQP